MALTRELCRNFKELRILFSPNSPSSSSTRAFIEKNYTNLKTENPKIPILIREASGIQPQLWARFGYGLEKGINLEGLSEKQICKAIEDLNNEQYRL